MMDMIRQWALSICVTVVAATIFSMLIPNGSMEKVVRFAVSLFFLVSLLSPFIGGRIDWNIDFNTEAMEQQDTVPLQESIDRQMTTIVENRLEASVTQLLAGIDVEPEKIEIQVNVGEDNSICISRLVLRLGQKDQNKGREASDLLKKEVGVTPEISYTQTE